jgi:hypothetical protein
MNIFIVMQMIQHSINGIFVLKMKENFFKLTKLKMQLIFILLLIKNLLGFQKIVK